MNPTPDPPPDDDLPTTPRIWWFLYPLTGLAWRARRPDFTTALFGDATLLAAAHLPRVFPAGGPLNLSHGPGIEHLMNMGAWAGRGRTFDALLAVRRTGLFTAEQYPPLLEAATTRAYQVAALLALAHLATQPDGATCALSEQIAQQLQAVTVLEFQDQTWQVRFQGVGFPAVAVHHRPIPHTRRSLGALLRQPVLAPLAAVLGAPGLRLPTGLRAAVIQSAVRLAEALYPRTPAAQLLGAVTAIEILVSDQIETYDQIRRRIVALLGREALDQYAVEAVLRARHRYVHQGDPDPARAVVPPAIGLALAALLRYAAAAPAFPDKGALLDYLDWTAAGDRLARTWTAAEQRTLGRLRKHTAAPLAFPFLTPPPAAAEPAS